VRAYEFAYRYSTMAITKRMAALLARDRLAAVSLWSVVGSLDIKPFYPTF
jgi:hypothetical protein